MKIRDLWLEAIRNWEEENLNEDQYWNLNGISLQEWLDWLEYVRDEIIEKDWDREEKKWNWEWDEDFFKFIEENRPFRTTIEHEGKLIQIEIDPEEE